MSFISKLKQRVMKKNRLLEIMIEIHPELDILSATCIDEEYSDLDSLAI